METTGGKSNQDAGGLGKAMAELMGVLGSQETKSRLSRLAARLAEVRASSATQRAPRSQRRRPRRPGWVVKAVAQVLADHGEPMRARDVHRTVEALVGEPVAWSSIRGALADNVSGPSLRFVRIARGRYVLAGDL